MAGQRTQPTPRTRPGSMRLAACVALLVLGASGCASGPCAGVTLDGRACVEVTVRAPGGTTVDAASLHVAVGGAYPHAFALDIFPSGEITDARPAVPLPASFALVLQKGGPFTVEVTALDGDAQGLADGTASGTAVAGAITRLEVDTAPGEVSDGGTLPDAGPAGPDLASDLGVSRFPAHFGAAPVATCDLDLPAGDHAFDTDGLTLDGKPLPTGCATTRASFLQAPSTLVVTLLSVHDFTLQAGGTLRLVGGRGFALVASGTVTLGGLLDGSAHGVTPGAGGFGPATRPGVDRGFGAGGNGTEVQSSDNVNYVYLTAGGGGGGYGTAGGKGGAASFPSVNDAGTFRVEPALGGPVGVTSGGTIDDDLATAVWGGSAGGEPGILGDCGGGVVGGGGGGSVQVSAAKGIQLGAGGGISVGGGGGGAGCLGDHTAQAGGGGGAGGAIYLEAPTVSGASGSFLTANGGGGGSGASYTGVGPMNGTAGLPGEDGHASAQAAAGGATTDSHLFSGAGGSGATGNTPASDGESRFDESSGNGGGGGGGLGRIVVRAPVMPALQSLSSPAWRWVKP